MNEILKMIKDFKGNGGKRSYDDVPECCRACGGDYPNCASSCPLWDD